MSTRGGAKLRPITAAWADFAGRAGDYVVIHRLVSEWTSHEAAHGGVLNSDLGIGIGLEQARALTVKTAFVGIQDQLPIYLAELAKEIEQTEPGFLRPWRPSISSTELWEATSLEQLRGDVTSRAADLSQPVESYVSLFRMTK